MAIGDYYMQSKDGHHWVPGIGDNATMAFTRGGLYTRKQLLEDSGVSNRLFDPCEPRLMPTRQLSVSSCGRAGRLEITPLQKACSSDYTSLETDE